jgi:pimeloyl-ACP methyl ester carboxylesterase
MPFFQSFDGTRIHYAVTGAGSPVMLAHGFATDAASTWPPAGIDLALAKAGYRAIMLDLRGHGQSGKPHDSSAYDNDAEVRDIMALAKYLRLGRYDTLGYSHGAIVMARLLVLDANVRKAVLGGVGHFFTDPTWRRPRQIAAGLLAEDPDDPVSRGLVGYAKENNGDLVALANVQRGQPTTTPAELARVQQPVMVLCGDQDQVNGSPQRLAELIPDCTLSYVRGTHLKALHNPEFAQAVVDFLLEA